MGEIADSMIEGFACAECGVYLENNETVYAQHDRKKSKVGCGFPVICKDCK